MVTTNPIKLYSPTKKQKPIQFRPSFAPYLIEFANAGAGGLTDFELAGLLGKYQPTACLRRGEITKLGLLEDSGTKRKSPSGAYAIVWRITNSGRAKVLILKGNNT